MGVAVEPCGHRQARRAGDGIDETADELGFGVFVAGGRRHAARDFMDVLPVGCGALESDEAGALGVAALVQPVGVDESRRVGEPVCSDRVEEGAALRVGHDGLL